MSQRVFVRNLGGTPIVIDVLEVGDTGLGAREVLTADRTLYVRTDGSDSNDGSANTAGSAFLTVQKAVDVAVAFDLGIYAVTIQITGAFAENLILKSYIGNGPITLLGDSAVPTAGAFRIGDASGVGITASAVLGDWVLDGIEVISGDSLGLLVENGSVVRISNFRAGACSSAQIAALSNGLITNISRAGVFASSFAISGSGGSYLHAVQQGYIHLQVATVTLTGTPAYTGLGFATCGTNSTIEASSVTWTGSATGTRFGVSNGGVIFTGGGGANYFPGNAAGTGTNFSASPYGLYV